MPFVCIYLCLFDFKLCTTCPMYPDLVYVYKWQPKDFISILPDTTERDHCSHLIPHKFGFLQASLSPLVAIQHLHSHCHSTTLQCQECRREATEEDINHSRRTSRTSHGCLPCQKHGKKPQQPLVGPVHTDQLHANATGICKRTIELAYSPLVLILFTEEHRFS